MPRGHKNKEVPTSGERALRDSLIVQRTAQGWPQKDIAAEAGLRVRQVQTILERERARAGSMLRRRSPARIVEWLLRECEAQLAHYTLAAAEAGTNINARIGALHGRRESLDRLVALLQALGQLPQDLSQLAQMMDTEAAADQMVEAVDTFLESVSGLELSKEVQERVEEAASGVRATFEEWLGLDDDEGVMGAEDVIVALPPGDGDGD